MEINLRVVNRQTQTFERDVRLSLTEEGVTLGRSPGNDLCLEDPERVVSGRHARLDPRDGGIWITDTSSNGTYLNDAVDPLPSHQSVALHDGDRLIVGAYEITVTLGARPAAVAGSNPFSDLAASDDLPGLARVGGTADILDLLDPGGGRDQHQAPAGAMPSRSAERHLADDPFADAAPLNDVLAGPAADAPAREAPPRHTPVEHVFYRPAEHQPVPDDYDLLSDAWTPAAPEPEPRPPSDLSQPSLAVPEPNGIETVTLDLNSLPSEASPAVMPPTPDFSEPSPPAPVTHEPDTRDADRLDLSWAEAAPADLPPPRRPEPPRPGTIPQRVGSGSELEAFLTGLGTGNPAEIEHPKELLQHAGELLRVLATGLTQTMMGRAQFKSELRLGVTTIRAAENNPFKFSVAADDILDRLLFRPTPGFLPAVPAARSAFEDIQAHEMAMTAGLQAALRALLARFEPAELERRLSRRSGLDKVLPIARKARYWDLFTETYEQAAADAAEDFMQIFGDAFARAYQEQIRRLAESRGPRRGERGSDPRGRADSCGT
ncbi:type VI secretion system-associated FHA domain protein TagH [Thiocystis violascens]|uniref:FHA domain protein n=1 Tax=Thiocystis violascens (strain ATCC 17096 / DSM 198 / 6111) TaxID=765911 RepID=I3YB77_THIV6|nr:type VI secretion system-associated FHA domain protein TagH [Thiocystis violascens]AFL74245.1 FHA domain protein [Thiocystis violascens DSM 198]